MERWAIEVREQSLVGRFDLHPPKWTRVFEGEVDDATLRGLVGNWRGLRRTRVLRLAEPEPGDQVVILRGPLTGAFATFLGRPTQGLSGANVRHDGMEKWVPAVSLQRRSAEDARDVLERNRAIRGDA